MEALNAVDHVYFKDARDMSEVKTGSAQLVIFNPPRVGTLSTSTSKKGEEELFDAVLGECTRVCMLGGAIACVVTDFKYAPRHAYFMGLAEKHGLYFYDQKIWIRGFGVNRSDKKHFSHVLVYANCHPFIKTRNKTPAYAEEPWIFTQSQVFEDFDAAMAFEVPERLIGEFTELGGLVVSPFAGIGTEVDLALYLGRKVVAYEINPARKPDIIAREKQFLHDLELSKSGEV